MESSLAMPMSKSRRTMTRFSSLPDHLTHQILSFLSMEDISRLCCVSRRCRELCLSTPFLNFDVNPHTRNPAKRARLMDFIERFLLLRQGTAVQHCRIRWDRLIREEFRVLSWLHNALACNVKHLVLDLAFSSGAGSQYLALPPTLLRSTSLRSLEMSFSNGVAILKIPSTTSCSSLERLKLKSVRVDESLGKWISSNCKSLKKLHLEAVSGTSRIIIDSASLQDLDVSSPAADLLHLHVSAQKLRFLRLTWTFDSPNNRELRLSTPKLKILYWTGHILNLSATENFNHLLGSVVLLTPCPGFNPDSWALSHVIRAVCSSTVLNLSDYCIQDLLSLGCLPIVFANLLALRICVSGTSVNLAPSLTSFFKGIPSLCSLFIIGRELTRSCCGIKIEEACAATGRWGWQNTPLLHNLKYVTIELVSQQKNELDLIEYFLKNAKNLIKMTLLFSSYLRSDFTKKISKYEKASPNVILNFQLI